MSNTQIYPASQAKPKGADFGGKLRCESINPAGEGMHEASCVTWSSKPAEFDAIAAYLSAIRPVYDAAKNCIGQLSGILLLLQTASLERRNELIGASVAQQLSRSEDLWRAIQGPHIVQKHRAKIGQLLGLLRKVLTRLDRLESFVDRSSPDLETVVNALFTAHRTLLELSDPDRGLSPIDFTAACCNCRSISGKV
ncbi:hypothetical protein [Phyllobacterium sp. SB3]|uniref:hypothetical protein n=1 Tax=Phyllobacterium sp. SB3 TaxID=3156073 RepID=UPI0032AED752